MGFNGKSRISAPFCGAEVEMFGFCSRLSPLWISLLLTESRTLELRKLFEERIEVVVGLWAESI
jgi:hypothetical protein